MPIDRKVARKTLEQAPFSAAVGLKIVSTRDGEAVVKMPFNPRNLNYGGDEVPIHGGAIASLADFSACAAVWTAAETERSATISMTVNYVAPAIRTGLVAHARIRRKGKRVASLSVEIHDDDGELIADALVTYKIA
jgi:uncharacterized protein (TIGR00369 family)